METSYTIVILGLVSFFLNVGFCTLRKRDVTGSQKLLEQGEAIYIIETTWNNISLLAADQITVKLSTSKEGYGQEEQLVVTVEAPFYDDPRIPDNTPPDTMWELWESEVVELYLLGPGDHYLELEFSPKGQYLILELRGYRTVIRDKLPLYKNDYMAKINSTTNRWTGRAIIPNCYLPAKIDRFNAYAIHGGKDNRVYKALFPTKNGEFKEPDFHRLAYFKSIDFKNILHKNMGVLAVVNPFLFLCCFLLICSKQ